MKEKRNTKYLAALLAALVLAAGPAPGAELQMGEQEIEADEPMAIDLKWELEVLFLGAFRPEENGKPQDTVRTAFIVTARQDMDLEFAAGEAYDDMGHQFPLLKRDPPIYIGGQNAARRRLIAGVPTLVHLYHSVYHTLGRPTFTRMKFWFNGRELELRNVRTQDEAAWRDILSKHRTLGTPHWFH